MVRSLTERALLDLMGTSQICGPSLLLKEWGVPHFLKKKKVPRSILGLWLGALGDKKKKPAWYVKVKLIPTPA